MATVKKPMVSKREVFVTGDRCPWCGFELVAQKSCAGDFIVVDCHNLVEEQLKTKTRTVPCGFKGFRKEQGNETCT